MSDVACSSACQSVTRKESVPEQYLSQTGQKLCVGGKKRIIKLIEQAAKMLLK